MSATENIAGQVQTTYEQYKKIKTLVDVGFFLIDYVVMGGEVTKDIKHNDRINISEIVASLEFDVIHHEEVSFKTKIPNTIYYLDYRSDGMYSFDTVHHSGSYLPIAEVTTDANGNVSTITDNRGDVGGFRLRPGYEYPEITALQAETATQVYNVKTGFGAKGDGVTDDTSSIQSAVDKASANGGGEIYFPPGVYIVSTWINLKSNVHVTGVRGASIVKLAVIKSKVNPPGLFLILNNNGIPLKNITISNLTLDGNKENQTVLDHLNSAALIDITSQSTPSVNNTDIVVTDCTVQNHTGWGIVYMFVTRGIISKNIVNDVDRDGISCFFTNDNIVISNNILYNTGDDAIGLSTNTHDDVLSHITVANNVIFQSGSRGINISGHHITVTGNIINTTASSGIMITNGDFGQRCDHIIVSGNTIEKAGTYTGGIGGETHGGWSIYVVDSNRLDGFQISDVIISENIIDGAYYPLQNIAVFGNHPTKPINKVQIVNNTVEDGGVISVGQNTDAAKPTKVYVINNMGYNGAGAVTTPDVPASDVVFVNATSQPVQVFISGGSVAGIYVNNMLTGLTQGSINLKPYDSIVLVYTTAPTWKWLGM